MSEGPPDPAGGTWGSELESGTFTHILKSPCQCASLPPAVSGQKSCFRVGQKLLFQVYYF